MRDEILFWTLLGCCTPNSSAMASLLAKQPSSLNPCTYARIILSSCLSFGSLSIWDEIQIPLLGDIPRAEQSSRLLSIGNCVRLFGLLFFRLFSYFGFLPYWYIESVPHACTQCPRPRAVAPGSPVARYLVAMAINFLNTS